MKLDFGLNKFDDDLGRSSFGSFKFGINSFLRYKIVYECFYVIWFVVLFIYKNIIIINKRKILVKK